ncbi:hypothetical protein [Novosphingobium sp. B 225]|uniref:hypothetical protein n=1 Tax=Novosphingobium sp. B 225 TaxID=1961849 RepID=UPI000B4BDF74|nr:hypothetical protein [Novosphingobium sp. B 225]
MTGTTIQTDDRFASWGKWPARLLLAALAALLLAAALVPIEAAVQNYAKAGLVEQITGAKVEGAERPRDYDLQLYDFVVERIGQGENYYKAAAEGHRHFLFPLRPGFAVRLPTLAYLQMILGEVGQMAAAVGLMLAVLWAWWRRLGDEGCSPRLRRLGTTLIFFGAALGLNRYYFALHELWAGQLLALSLALHRPGQRWLGAFIAAGLALAIREHALPYVLLMGAFALWRGDRKEALAWAALVAAFGGALAWHLHMVAQQVLPSDGLGPPWLVLRGLSGWLSNVVLSSNMRFLPHWLAGPLVMLAILGWAGWKRELGAFATLLFLGYGLVFMIVGRPDNFYWGAMIAPALFAGLIFTPRALGSLWHAGFNRS